MAMRMAFVFFAVGYLLSLLMACQGTNVYTVGDEHGWTLDYDYQKWAAAKTFHVGDTLVFNYGHSEMSMHNVVRVNRTAYAKCITHPNMGLYESGSDKIVLSSPGHVWFICGTPGHCEGGMKLQITVRKPRSHPHIAPSQAPEIESVKNIPASSPNSSLPPSPECTSDSSSVSWLTWLPWH